MAHSYDEDVQPPEDSWVRLWLDDAQVSLVPALPDLPVVVRPEQPFRLPPGHAVELTVALPLWVQMRTDDSSPALLDLATVSLSKSWFGSFTDGVLAYWVHSDLQHGDAPPNALPHQAVLWFRVSNTAREILEVDHFTIPAPNLSLYSDGQRFWLEPLTLTYRGSRLHTQIQRRKRPPRVAGRVTETTPPRESSARTFVGRVFGRRGELPGLGVRFR
ncbi:MAG: DUF432 domain-containing protein [Calditrichaeota bacterium]|nr:DUF432 domain-containing protein [Calditrichota bacterium]